MISVRWKYLQHLQLGLNKKELNYNTAHKKRNPVA
jgi:hypothetical protein